MMFFLNKGYLITFLIILLCNFVSISQTIQRNQSVFNKFSNDLDQKLIGKFETIPGEFFWNKNWENGEIKTKTNIFIDSIKLRYCVFNQEFNIIKSSDTLAITNTALIDYIKINNTMFIYAPTQINKEIKTNCFEVLCDGNVQLLKNHTCVFVKGNQNTSSFVAPIPDHYETRSLLFIKTPNNPAYKLPANKKKILKLIKDKKTEMNIYLKTNKLNLNKETDLIRFFSFYNEILN